MEIIKGRSKTLREIAQEEVNAELEAVALKKLKAKMKELKTAKLLVRNLEREIQDLEEELQEELK